MAFAFSGRASRRGWDSSSPAAHGTRPLLRRHSRCPAGKYEGLAAGPHRPSGRAGWIATRAVERLALVKACRSGLPSSGSWVRVPPGTPFFAAGFGRRGVRRRPPSP
jgi:hypothetical protein